MTPERLTAALAGHYRLERELGAGGMATVYLAHDLKHDRQVAIKVLRPELAAVIGAERFLSEIKTTANLQHPHILPLFDSGIARVESEEPRGVAADSTPLNSQLLTFLYYVMPYVEGESLRDRLNREKQLPISDAIRITTEVAGALDYAHRRGVIHRDIKPENILLHDGRALIADFGIALAASKAGGSRMTETGMSLGTPHYMSPEQAMGERVLDARTDVYALGVVAYELLVGDPPFIGSTAQAIVAKVMTEKPTPLSTVRDTVPAAVEDAILIALSKLPADRFASAAEFATALQDGKTAGRQVRTTMSKSAARLPSSRLAVLPWALALGAVVLAGWSWSGRATTGPSTYDLGLPDSAPMSFRPSGGSYSYGITLRALSISHDGTFAVYTAIHGDSTTLWYRDLRDGSVRPIPGTLGGSAPRISPDGTRLSYLGENRLMVMPLAGGEPREVYRVTSATYSQGWVSDGELFVIDRDGDELHRIDVDGRGVRSQGIPRCHFANWDAALGKLVCSINRYGLEITFGSDSAERLFTPRSEEEGPVNVAGTAFRVVDKNYLVYLAMNGDLVAATYDARTHLAGRAVTLLQGIRREGAGEAHFDISAHGDLLYAPGADATVGRMVTLRKGGVPAPLEIESAEFQRYDLSRDRRHFAGVVQTATGQELRIYDLRDHQQYTFARAEAIRHPHWSPDGGELYLNIRNNARLSFIRGYPGTARGNEVVYAINSSSATFDFMDIHDDHLALIWDSKNSTVFRVDPSRPVTVLDTVLTGARFPSLAPNGKLILFQGAEGSQVMITNFPTPGRFHLLASQGVEPIWLSASEVLYREGYSWYSVRVDPDTGEPQGAPVLWGRDPRFSDTSGWSNRPTHDGGIIYVQGPDQTSTAYLRVIPNWVAQMKAAVDAAN